jgi:hypothetical protein
VKGHLISKAYFLCADSTCSQVVFRSAPTLPHYTTGAHRELAALIKKEQPDFVQFNYSIATRDAESKFTGRR